RVMNDPAYDIFSYKYDAAAGTLHTAVYFPEEMKAWFAIGADRPPLIFNFQQWLDGKDTAISRIRGKIDYPGGFANMVCMGVSSGKRTELEEKNLLLLG